MDALELLRAQHADLRDRFDGVRRARSSAARRRELDLLADAANLHLVVESRHLDPLLYELEMDGIAARSEVAHRLIAHTMADLCAMEADDPRFDSALAVLCAEIARHCDEEELRVFPALARTLSAPLLRALALSMLETIAEIDEAARGDGAHARQAASAEAPG